MWLTGFPYHVEDTLAGNEACPTTRWALDPPAGDTPIAQHDMTSAFMRIYQIIHNSAYAINVTMASEDVLRAQY